MSMTFTYQNLSLTLPNPDFDNSNRFNFDQINRKTRGGDLIVYRDGMWPKAEQFGYKWTALKQQDLYNLLQFVKATLGRVVHVIDFEGRTFDVIIIPGEMNQPARFRFGASIEYVSA